MTKPISRRQFIAAGASGSAALPAHFIVGCNICPSKDIA